MTKKIYLMLICSFLLISCDNTDTNVFVGKDINAEYNYPPQIVATIDDMLDRIRGASYYDCVKNEVYKKLKGQLTEKDIRVATFQGRTNIDYTGATLEMLNKITNTITYVLDNSNCIETWK